MKKNRKEGEENNHKLYFIFIKYLISPEVIGKSTHLYNGDGVVTSVSLSRWERADIVVLVTGFYEDVVRLVSCAHNS